MSAAELEDDIPSEEEEEFNEGDAEEEDSDEEEAPRKGGAKAGKRPAARKQGGKAGKRGRNIFVDDAAEEEDDDDDGGKRRTKQKRSRYIDDMAAEDRDAEEEDDEEHEEDFDDLIANDADPDAAREGHSNYQQVHEMRRKEAEVTEEELEEFVRQKYTSRSYDQDDREEDIGTVGQQGLLPTKSDARLWAVQCKPGAEREAVVCLLQKAVEFAARNERLGMSALGIKSAFAHDHIKGFIWVEAHKMDYVRDALRGLRIIFQSKPVHQVPLAQMVETINVPKPAKALLERDSWARMKNGLYKDDLVRVIDVDYSSNRATVEVVPRLDYTNLDAPKQPFGRGSNKGLRPPARPFNPGEAKDAGASVEREHKRLTDGSVFYLLNGKQRFTQGYLQRTFAISSLRICETLPPLDELQRFKQAAQSVGETDGTPGDLSALMDTLKDQEAPAPTFVKGDRIEVVAGDLTGLRGRVERIDEEGMVHVRPTGLDGVKEAIEIEPRDIVKFFNEGDHVKVVAGQMSGETGMVIQLADNIATLFLDSSRKEVKLFTRDLTESADIVAGVDRLGPYEQHDLVALAEAGVVGVIVECGPDSCRVLTNRGTPDRPELRTARLPDIKRKLMMRNAVSNDQGLNPVAVGDMVDVKRGAMSDKSGTVKFIFQGSLFLHSREVKTHGGFFCVNARDTRVRGAKANSYSNPSQTPSRVSDILAGLRSPGPGRTPGNVFRSPQLGASTQSQSLTGTSGGGFSGRSAGARRDESLVGRNLNIMRGPHNGSSKRYRGYRGRVASATETHCRIELEAQYRTVTVKRSDLKLEGENAVPGSRTPSSPWDTPTTPAHPGGRTPLHSGAQTPMHAWGSQTPMHPGSMTPGRAPMTPGRETPGHGSAWAPQTPMRPSDAPATPGAWNPDYTTPGGSFASSPHEYGATPTAYSPGSIPTPQTAYTPGSGPHGQQQYSPTRDDFPGSAPSSVPYSPSLHGSGVSTPGYHSSGGATPAAVPSGPSVESQVWSGLHVVLADGRGGMVQAVAADHTATVALGDTTEEGRLRLWQPEQTAAVPLTELTLATCLKGDQVRLVANSANAPAGFTAQLAQIQEDEYIIKKDNGTGDLDIKFVEISITGRIVVPGEV